MPCAVGRSEDIKEIKGGEKEYKEEKRNEKEQEYFHGYLMFCLYILVIYNTHYVLGFEEDLWELIIVRERTINETETQQREIDIWYIPVVE